MAMHHHDDESTVEHFYNVTPQDTGNTRHHHQHHSALHTIVEERELDDDEDFEGDQGSDLDSDATMASSTTAPPGRRKGLRDSHNHGGAHEAADRTSEESNTTSVPIRKTKSTPSSATTQQQQQQQHTTGSARKRGFFSRLLTSENSKPAIKSADTTPTATPSKDSPSLFAALATSNPLSASDQLVSPRGQTNTASLEENTHHNNYNNNNNNNEDDRHKDSEAAPGSSDDEDIHPSYRSRRFSWTRNGSSSQNNDDKRPTARDRQIMQELDKQNWKLKKENAEMKMENCHLFKELDILNRRIIMKFKPELVRASIATLNKAQIFPYTIDAALSYSVELSEFLAKYYTDFPEVKALVAIFLRGRDRQNSVAIRSDRLTRKPSIAIRSGILPNKQQQPVAGSQNDFQPPESPRDAMCGSARAVKLNVFDSDTDAELAKWQHDVSMLREEDIIAEDPFQHRESASSTPIPGTPQSGEDGKNSKQAVTDQFIATAIQTDSEKPFIVNRQFARDVPSLVRINGKVPAGRTDNEKVVQAHTMLMESTQNDTKFVQLIMQLANQNLGIVIYEKLVKNYWEMGLVVKQSWQHYLDITLNPRVFPRPTSLETGPQEEDGCAAEHRVYSKAIIYMLAIFRLENMEDSEGVPPLFVKGTIEMFLDSRVIHIGKVQLETTDDTSVPPATTSTTNTNSNNNNNNNNNTGGGKQNVQLEEAFTQDEVRITYSTPTFDVLAFLHSLDIPDDDA